MDDMDGNRYGHGGPPMRHTSRRDNPTMERYGDGAGSRSVDRQNNGFDGGSCMGRGRGGEHQRRKSQRPSFEEELEGLYGVISDAMSYYDGFLRGFHRDIQFIKSYAGPDVLDHLWNSKVSASDKRTAARTGGHSERETHRETARSEPTTTFQDMARKLCDHLYATMKAAGKARHARDGENAGHVHAKLGKSVKELTKDLERAPYRAKDTKNLMTELEMLLTFLGANGASQGNRRETGYGQNQQTEHRYDEQEGSGAYQEEQGTDPTFNGSL